MPNMKKMLILVLFASSLSTAVSAAVKDKTYLEVYLGAEIYSFDQDRDLESLISKAAGLEVPLNNYFSISP